MKNNAWAVWAPPEAWGPWARPSGPLDKTALKANECDDDDDLWFSDVLLTMNMDVDWRLK